MTQTTTWRLPSPERVAYIRNSLEIIVLLLALPWILYELLTHPLNLSRRLAGHAGLK